MGIKDMGIKDMEIKDIGRLIERLNFSGTTSIASKTVFVPRQSAAFPIIP